MHKPILMKFGTQQQIRNSMTVTSPNIKILKISLGRLPPNCETLPGTDLHLCGKFQPNSAVLDEMHPKQTDTHRTTNSKLHIPSITMGDSSHAWQ